MLIIIEITLAVALVLLLNYWHAIDPEIIAPVFSEEVSRDSYAQTQHFRNTLQQKMWDAVFRINNASRFETDGMFDPDIGIDIMKYSRGDLNDSGVVYRLGDLEQWSRRYGGHEFDENRIVVSLKMDGTYSYYYYSDFVNLIEEGQLIFVGLSNAQRTTILNRLWSENIIIERHDNLEVEVAEGTDWFYTDDDMYHREIRVEPGMSNHDFRGIANQEGELLYVSFWLFPHSINERFAPVGWDSLVDLVNHDARWNGRLSYVVERLRNVLGHFAEDVWSYRETKDRLLEGNTNFSYIFFDEATRELHTNREAFRNIDDLEANLETLRQSGKYVIIASRLSDFESNLAWPAEVITNYMWETREGVFAVSVDTEFPIPDIFYQNLNQYMIFAPWSRTAMIMGAISVILFFVILVWLTMVAGRNRQEGLHLNIIDSWGLEIYVGLMLILLVFPSWIIADQTFAFPNIIWETIMIAYVSTILLTFYLGMVRRIKSESFWSNSATLNGVLFTKEVIGHRSYTSKVIIQLAAIVIIHLFGFFFTLIMNSLIPFFMVLLMDIGIAIYIIKRAIGWQKIKMGLEKMAAGDIEYQIPLSNLDKDQLEMVKRINNIGEGLHHAVEESVKSERLKTDLITNVSHDIKTPLTSIINYVDLLKRENFEDPKVQGYLDILDKKSQRLKHLTEDVVEASKISSGNIKFEFTNLNLVEMITQVSGDFAERFRVRNLVEVLNLPEEEVMIHVDGRRLWRILENIHCNAAKYAMPGTRVYIDMKLTDKSVTLSMKNISEQSLNIDASELTERFIRGDVSRAAEGSGLGLSIAQSLTEKQGGQFNLYLDGDLFKVSLTFPRISSN